MLRQLGFVAFVLLLGVGARSSGGWAAAWGWCPLQRELCSQDEEWIAVLLLYAHKVVLPVFALADIPVSVVGGSQSFFYLLDPARGQPARPSVPPVLAIGLPRLAAGVPHATYVPRT
mmetsp:Transcript_38191/g.87350  ORF Transcript_38191/g.87350 Transcript_38191/m.87350 type:complete len:117 (-) Transcript_38191:31-381(-)